MSHYDIHAAHGTSSAADILRCSSRAKILSLLAEMVDDETDLAVKQPLLSTLLPKSQQFQTHHNVMTQDVPHERPHRLATQADKDLTRQQGTATKSLRIPCWLMLPTTAGLAREPAKMYVAFQRYMNALKAPLVSEQALLLKCMLWHK